MVLRSKKDCLRKKQKTFCERFLCESINCLSLSVNQGVSKMCKRVLCYAMKSNALSLCFYRPLSKGIDFLARFL